MSQTNNLSDDFDKLLDKFTESKKKKKEMKSLEYTKL